MVSDSWFESAMATTAALYPKLIEQRFIELNVELGYCVVTFWKDGEWTEVLIDDRLLVLGGEWRGYTSTVLVYAHTVNQQQAGAPGPHLWVSLLQKVSKTDQFLWPTRARTANEQPLLLTQHRLSSYLWVSVLQRFSCISVVCLWRMIVLSLLPSYSHCCQPFLMFLICVISECWLM